MVIARLLVWTPSRRRYLPTNTGADGTDQQLSSCGSPAAGSEGADKESPLVEFGACFWAHGATWPEMRDAALAAEVAGFDAIWTDDHLVNDMGDPEIPVFEGWTTLAAWAVVTNRPRLGLLVGAAPLRDPGLLAKSAITVDHISGGRVTLGLGSGWFASEYERYGIGFGDGEERADRLDELASLVRRLLDGDRVTHQGRHYALADAFAEPRPVQAHLPILIGGSGPRRTLRTVARIADMWNMPDGSPAQFLERDAILRGHAEAAGRDESAIARTILVYGAIRDDAATAEAALHAATSRFTGTLVDPPLIGDVAAVADGLRPYLAAGVSQVMFGFYAPFDVETVRRLGELRDALAANS
jgi:alkanesulfonate monooxygenase SsuD/methylene tetrahydromethanopterin reductase-like flavin-dependent oxidoreductase (luciferase family)